MNTNRNHQSTARRTLTVVEQKMANLADRWDTWGTTAARTITTAADRLTGSVDVDAPIPYLPADPEDMIFTFTDEQGYTWTTNSEY